MKLWQKDTIISDEVEVFTVGNDRELDLELAPFDVIGSLAHALMLYKIGLINETEKDNLCDGLYEIYETIKEGNFRIEDHVEDVHSQVELILTQKYGETGKKIHTGRSRNDQVLLDLKLYTRNQIKETVLLTQALFTQLIYLSETYSSFLLPGYTHLQLAMPSSFGLWFGAYAESLVDDLTILQAAYKVTNRNPLGSGAGYGSSFPLDREYTSELLGFDCPDYNVVYAQMTRGKTERLVSAALAGIGATLARFSMDICLFMNQNFGFISFPDHLTTGSSIMPHKKNPDVFELIRAKCNRLQALPNQLAMVCTNLPSGYQRDMQLIKESFIPAFAEIKGCLTMMAFMLEQIEINEEILKDPKYLHLFTVEAVNDLVLKGVPFRDAYKKIGAEIESGKFEMPEIHLPGAHTHSGSMGNLANEKIQKLMDEVIGGYGFEKVEKAISQLIHSTSVEG